MAGQKSRTPRVVVVTGASAGVGRATARAFAAQGDALGLISRGVAGLEAAAGAPIFQPEAAAEAIVWAARKHPREVNVGAVTSASIWADKLLPGLLDRDLRSANT
jgi:NAD(P)-dependent dehydrogenase (short-subunit alcohol dehydrogenase family)